MNYAFLNDYNEICHKKVYEFVGKYYNERTVGYESDRFCKEASDMIKDLFNIPDALVQFFIGGTSTNLTMISHMLLRDYEAVIATKYAHIANHEGGAVEATGHKILIAEDKDGKILPESIEEIYLTHLNDSHMVLPKAVYISNSTEIGTVYTKRELKAIHDVCKKYNLYLYLDGARFFAAHYSKYNDIDFEDYGKYVDAFYIGGTKNGLMLGEAAIIVNDQLKGELLRQLKNKGAVLAKGSLIGLNFMALLTDSLYKEMAENADRKAEKLAEYLASNGFDFTWPPETNQIFVNMRDDQIAELKKEYGFDDMGYVDCDKKLRAVRLVTSFNTKDEDLDGIFKAIERIKG